MKVKALTSNIKHEKKIDTHLVAELQNVKPENLASYLASPLDQIVWSYAIGSFQFASCFLFTTYESPLKYEFRMCAV